MAGTVYGTADACTYDRFWEAVGEPRGLRTHPGFRVPGWLYTVLEAGPCLHGRLTEFSLCFTEFGTVLTSVLLSLALF